MSTETTRAVFYSGIFFLIGLLTQIIAVIMTDKRNHKRKLDELKIEHKYKVKYLQKELIFSKKIELYEGLSSKMNQDIQFYWNILDDIKKGKRVNHWKQEKKTINLYLETSDLIEKGEPYLNSYKLNKNWVEFTDLEEKIDKSLYKGEDLKKLEKLWERLFNKKEDIILQLKKDLELVK